MDFAKDSNPALKAIFERRSIRVYTPEPVPELAISTMLEAAMAAPSAAGKDPWRFVVITNRQTLLEIANALPHGRMLETAPLGIMVCGDIEKAHGAEISYLLQDCAAAIQNLLLCAHALGLGACWLGVHPREDRIASVRQILRLPPAVVPVSCISIGHPGEVKEARTRYNADYVRYVR